MAKMIVVIGPDAAQNRQFVEQMKYQEAHQLEGQRAATVQPDSQTDERLPSPVLSRDFELEKQQEAQQGRVLDLSPAGQPGGALEPREPDVRYVEVTPIDDGDDSGGNALPGPTGQEPQRQGPELEEPEDEFKEWKPPSHEFGHNATDDPRQMLLREMQKDIKDFQSAWEFRTANAEQQAQPEQTAPAHDAPQPGTGIEIHPDAARQVQVTQERESSINAPALDRETVIDAEFRQVDPDGPQGPIPSQAQPAHHYAETHINADTPEPPAQQEAAIEQARADIAADKTVVVTATEYSPEVKQLIEEARAQGHRVQVAVIGEQQGGQVSVRPEHLQHIPEMSKDSHYVSVYAQNDAGKYDLHATNYNDQAKVTPSVAPEVGNQLARGVEVKGLHDSVAVQQVDGFKDSHPAVTKMQAQSSRGMDYQ